MPAENMGRVPRSLRLALAVSSVALVIALAISPVKDLRREWKLYKRDYIRFAQTRPDTKRLLADSHPGIDQIWIPEMGVVDRCTTCHQGISQSSLAGASVPQPFRAHPPIPHHIQEWGCVVCHRGQGRQPKWRRPTKRRSPGNSPFCRFISFKARAAPAIAMSCRKRLN